MNLRFFHAFVLTMEEQEEEYERHELWVRDDRIVYVGQPADDRERAWLMEQCGVLPHGFDREIDCAGDVLMPGFQNAHAHSGMTLLRSAADDLPLSEWLNQQIFPREALLTPQDIQILTKLAIMEYVSGGITSVFDMYLAPDETAGAFIETGMRCVQCGTVNNFTHSVSQLEDYFLRLNELHPLIGYRLGFHAEYTTDKNCLKKSQLYLKNTGRPCICIYRRPKRKWKNAESATACRRFNSFQLSVCLSMGVPGITACIFPKKIWKFWHGKALVS